MLVGYLGIIYDYGNLHLHYLSSKCSIVTKLILRIVNLRKLFLHQYCLRCLFLGICLFLMIKDKLLINELTHAVPLQAWLSTWEWGWAGLGKNTALQFLQCWQCILQCGAALEIRPQWRDVRLSRRQIGRNRSWAHVSVCSAPQWMMDGGRGVDG